VSTALERHWASNFEVIARMSGGESINHECTAVRSCSRRGANSKRLRLIRIVLGTFKSTIVASTTPTLTQSGALAELRVSSKAHIHHVLCSIQVPTVHDTRVSEFWYCKHTCMDVWSSAICASFHRLDLSIHPFTHFIGPDRPDRKMRTLVG